MACARIGVMEPPQTECIYVKTEIYLTGTEYTLNGGAYFGQALRCGMPKDDGMGIVSITKNVVLLAFCSSLLISVTVSAREDPETGAPNVLLIGLCHAVIIVVRRARCDNAGAREHSRMTLLADTVWKRSGAV